jgi:hypothetical protein
MIHSDITAISRVTSTQSKLPPITADEPLR